MLQPERGLAVDCKAMLGVVIGMATTKMQRHLCSATLVQD